VITLSRPQKFILIGSAALLLLVTVALLALWLVRPPNAGGAWADPARPSSDGWTCQWLDAPTILHSADRTECRGVVQCRHETMRTFVPQIRRVICPIQDNACDPAACFTRSIRTP
jgi:hypothetical protein